MIPEIEIDPEACDGEGLCIRVCPEGIFQRTDHSTVPTVTQTERCFLCGQCVAVCPGDAIVHDGFDMANFVPFSSEMEFEPDALLGFLRMRRSVRNYHQKRPVRREILEQMRILFFGFGLAFGKEFHALTELAGGEDNSLKLYQSFRDPHSAFDAASKQYNFMSIGPVSPLSFSGTPLFFTAFNNPVNFLKINHLVKTG